MAQISLQIPDDQIARVVDALCQIGGYAGEPSDQPARRAFARRVLGDQLRQTVLRFEQGRAMNAASSSVTVDPLTVE